MIAQWLIYKLLLAHWKQGYNIFVLFWQSVSSETNAKIKPSIMASDQHMNVFWAKYDARDATLNNIKNAFLFCV